MSRYLLIMQIDMRTRRLGMAFAASVMLHVLLAAVLAWPLRVHGDLPDPSIRAFLVAPRDDLRFPGLERVNGSESASADVRNRLTPLTLPHLRIDVKAIAGRMHLLFPVLAPGLAIDSFFPNPASLGAPSLEHKRLGEDLHQAGQPLVLGDSAIQSIVDRSWARRGRWEAFQIIAKLMATHASGGSLPAILRAYREQNALQPYADKDSRDPRLWTQLALAADHVSFIGFVRTYASAHPSTEESAELLLLLDTIVQAEQDALHVLLETDPPSELDLTRQSNADAYGILLRIRQEYRAELTRRGLISRRQIDGYYDHVRLTILGRVADGFPNTPAANDARFLRGAVYWDDDRRSEAVSAWRGINGSLQGSYSISSAAVRLAIARTHIDGREIDRILKNENGRWLSLSYDRLRHFGYRFDTY